MCCGLNSLKSLNPGIIRRNDRIQSSRGYGESYSQNRYVEGEGRHDSPAPLSPRTQLALSSSFRFKPSWNEVTTSWQRPNMPSRGEIIAMFKEQWLGDVENEIPVRVWTKHYKELVQASTGELFVPLHRYRWIYVNYVLQAIFKCLS